MFLILLVVIGCDRLSSIANDCDRVRSIAINCDRLWSMALDCARSRSIAIDCGRLRLMGIDCGRLRLIAIDCDRWSLRSMAIECDRLRLRPIGSKIICNSKFRGRLAHKSYKFICALNQPWIVSYEIVCFSTCLNKLLGRSWGAAAPQAPRSSWRGPAPKKCTCNG